MRHGIIGLEDSIVLFELHGEISHHLAGCLHTSLLGPLHFRVIKKYSFTYDFNLLCHVGRKKNQVRGGGPNLLAIRVAFGGLSFCILSKEDSFYACHAQT